jgi:hypothetical protein
MLRSKQTNKQIIIIIIIIIQFFIYLCAERNSQWQITKSARIQIKQKTNTRIKQTKTYKMISWVFTFKHEFIKEYL